MLAPIRPMAATAVPSMPRGGDWTYEVKWDGYRALLLNDGRRARLLSRNLKDLSGDYPHIPKTLSRLTSQPILLDGEIVALDDEGRPSFQALQHRSAKRTTVVLYVFDLLHFGDASYLDRPLTERRRVLDRFTFWLAMSLMLAMWQIIGVGHTLAADALLRRYKSRRAAILPYIEVTCSVTFVLLGLGYAVLAVPPVWYIAGAFVIAIAALAVTAALRRWPWQARGVLQGAWLVSREQFVRVSFARHLPNDIRYDVGEPA